MALIVCEVGQNHCGSVILGEKLIRLAKDSGGDLVKFQLYDHKKIYGNDVTIPNVELDFNTAKHYFEYGAEIGIEVFFSVSDVERVKWCEAIGVRRYKIACGMRDKQLLESVKETNKPLIISSSESVFHYDDKDNIFWLYCIPEYPTPIEHIEMPFFMSALWNKWQGFSDHTIGLDASKIALARGAQIIEKHFSLSYTTGVDGAWSMLPEDLKELVRFSKVCEQAL